MTTALEAASVNYGRTSGGIGGIGGIVGIGGIGGSIENIDGIDGTGGKGIGGIGNIGGIDGRILMVLVVIWQQTRHPGSSRQSRISSASSVSPSNVDAIHVPILHPLSSCLSWNWCGKEHNLNRMSPKLSKLSSNPTLPRLSSCSEQLTIIHLSSLSHHSPCHAKYPWHGLHAHATDEDDIPHRHPPHRLSVLKATGFFANSKRIGLSGAV